MLQRGIYLLFGFVGMVFASGIAIWIAYNLLIERTPEFKAPPDPLLYVSPLAFGFLSYGMFRKGLAQKEEK